jgi:hypothetical protein
MMTNEQITQMVTALTAALRPYVEVSARQRVDEILGQIVGNKRIITAIYEDMRKRAALLDGESQ